MNGPSRFDGPRPVDGHELVARIPKRWIEPARAIAETLGAAGHRAWIVGGGVRDLVLGRELKDIDLVSAALPDEVEALFPKTVPVGKSFGIVVVVHGGVEIEVATFREERGYSDRRRPDQVIYTDDLGLDAKRRDFTCNALFLDPLDGVIEDPEGGLGDMARRQLRCVGKPEDRFREDGLRLLRMARFSAALSLEPAPGLLDAARAESSSLEGVSAERVLDELLKILRGPRAAMALRLMGVCGFSERCLPGEIDDARIAALEALGVDALLEAKLAALFGGEQRMASGALAALRASKELRVRTEKVDELARDIAEGSAPSTRIEQMGEEDRGALVARWRDELAPSGAELARARSNVPADVAEFVSLLEKLDQAAPLNPHYLSPNDLIGLGVSRGPTLGLTLRRLEHAALGGAFSDAESARRWARANGLLES